MINNLLFTLAKISKNPETAKRFRDLLCIQLCTQYLKGNLITLSFTKSDQYQILSFLFPDIPPFGRQDSKLHT